jgi:coenzyme F420-dependent glucose-6-phosphate dehydrogenase
MPARYFMAAAHEQFSPRGLLDQADAAERAGFDGVCCSDHFQPWWEPGESGQAWAWLGAMGERTHHVDIGTAVTAPVHRYHPALVAQFIATLEAMNPGRTFLGVGSGESLNESPLGMDWPAPAEQLERLDEAVDIITRLLDGEQVDGDRWFPMKQAYLHTRPARRPPVYVSAFGPKAAAVAARRGDGVWTLADPSTAAAVIDAYRDAADAAGRPVGEIILQATISWAADDEAAREGARMWKSTLVHDYFFDDWHDPSAMERRAQNEISDEEMLSSFIVAADPDEHVARIRDIEDLGATTVVLMNVSGADPVGAVETYGRHVLPALRGRLH